MAKKLIAKLVCMVILLASSAAMSDEDVQFKADNAVANILFDYDGAETYTTYVVDEDGYVDITFASNIPDALYSELLQKLKDNTDIKGVLAGTSGPACSLF